MWSEAFRPIKKLSSRQNFLAMMIGSSFIAGNRNALGSSRWSRTGGCTQATWKWAKLIFTRRLPISSPGFFSLHVNSLKKKTLATWHGSGGSCATCAEMRHIEDVKLFFFGLLDRNELLWFQQFTLGGNWDAGVDLSTSHMRWKRVIFSSQLTLTQRHSTYEPTQLMTRIWNQDNRNKKEAKWSIFDEKHRLFWWKFFS